MMEQSMQRPDKRESTGRESIMRRLRPLAPVLALLAAGALAGCAVHANPRHYPRDYPHSYPQQHPQKHAQGVHIPPGHLPPPGKCRVWYPNRPPGHQGPIGKCSKLQHRVPPGAVLVRG